ncbi:putative SAM-dependent methyltransferase [Ureibacillus xyleni]|uniref:Putative SAM-dependent methyltransferase n=1 Tax=Ureibacillus xyleni TaxID=614648 RepID=A0A285T1P6_9BACL|nr:class I SAM-dependent methyltransferase [Ureibacillus xyleni]SOC15137.1 putative SAM-dependent methyltransferase [Ureibacillus xyleni]
MRPITVVTTAGRPDELSITLAQKACEELGVRFEERKKRSVVKISEQLNAHVIVAGKNRYEYYPQDAKAPFFFHPNSAAFRLKRVARGEHDPFLDACQLEVGNSLLDCTLGIGSDAMLAAFQVGEEGTVVGLEADPNVAFIVQNGMATYDTSELPLTSCMRHIKVIQSEAVEFLQKQPDNAFDVVYMDPMFEEVIEESNNFEALRDAGEHINLTEEWVREAIRVAKKRVVLKAHFRSTSFEQFGFKRDIRLTSKFHYGVIEK